MTHSKYLINIKYHCNSPMYQPLLTLNRQYPDLSGLQDISPKFHSCGTSELCSKGFPAKVYHHEFCVPRTGSPVYASFFSTVKGPIVCLKYALYCPLYPECLLSGTSILTKILPSSSSEYFPVFSN